jgi:hypothetical protein
MSDRGAAYHAGSRNAAWPPVVGQFERQRPLHPLPRRERSSDRFLRLKRKEPIGRVRGGSPHTRRADFVARPLTLSRKGRRGDASASRHNPGDPPKCYRKIQTDPVLGRRRCAGLLSRYHWRFSAQSGLVHGPGRSVTFLLSGAAFARVERHDPPSCPLEKASTSPP